MGTTTKGLEPQKTTTQEAANVVSKGQPAQGMGPLLGAGGATMSTADDAGANSEEEECKDGHPVNVLTGDVIDDAIDLALPGVIPVSISRNYSSAFRGQPSLFGLGGWVLNFEQWIEETDAGLRYREADGRFLKFPVIAPGSGHYVRSKRYQIDCTSPGSYRITNVVTRLTHELSTAPGSKLARLRRIVDARSNHVDLIYDGERLTEVVDTAQRRIVLTPDEEGRAKQLDVFVAGKSEFKIRYGYHPDGELAWVEDPLGYSDGFEYDGAHRMVKTTLKNGVSFYYRYDAEFGKCIKTWGDGGLHEYEFLRERKDDHILVTTVGTEDPRLRKFNFAGDLIEDATLDGVVVDQKSYDSDHYVLTETNASGETNSFEYDECGNKTKATDAAGNVAVWEYEGDHPKRLTTADGLATEYRHNDFGDLVGVRYPTGLEYIFDYDAYGRVAAIYGPNGTIAHRVYDDQHNVVEEHDARGAVWSYTIDPLGRPLTRVDPLGAVTRVEYDALGQPTRIVRPDGTCVEIAYDPLGNVARFTDPQGHSREMQYIGTGCLVSQREADGTEWRFGYDSLERIQEIVNPKSERYRFFYNRVGRVEREETFDGRVFRFNYDTSGRIVKIEQPDEAFRRFAYDALGNIVEEDTPHGAQKYERDAYGRLVAATVIDGPEVIRVEAVRDEFGRIVREQQGDHTIEYTLDIQGRRTQRIVPGCGITKYYYDTTGATTRIQHEAPSGAKQDLRLERDLIGRETARYSFDGKLRIEQGYDTMDRLIEQKVQAPPSPGQAAQKLLSQRKWRYDSAGRALEHEDSRWGATRYGYDQLGQLMSAQRGNLHEVFEYQANGSLARSLNALVPEESVAGPSRWDVAMGNVLRQTDQHDYEYDRCHRRTAKVDRRTRERTEYIWDCRDRLREVRLPDGRQARYFYDAFGRRVRKEVAPNPAAAVARLNALGPPTVDPERVVAAEVSPDDAFGASLVETLQQLATIGQEVAPRITFFIWDGDELAAELDSETGPRGHVHHPGTFLPLMQVEQGAIFVVVTDHLGTPRDLLADDGTVRWSAAYTAWGKIHEEFVAEIQGPRGPPAVRSPFRLLGQYIDEETGLAATRYRMWDADTGRWCSPDPLSFEGGLNLFGFNGSPTWGVDPYGLMLCPEKIEELAQLLAKIVDERRPGGYRIADLQAKSKVPITSTDMDKIRARARELVKYKVTVDEDGNADFSALKPKNATLTEDQYGWSDKRQFREADRQIGGKQEGYTWHHTNEPGEMQSVPTGYHMLWGHSGGRQEGGWATGGR